MKVTEAQKDLIGVLGHNEEYVLKSLQKIYKQALNDVDDKLAALLGRKDVENLQTIINQVQYQNAIKEQLSGILDAMNGQQYKTISDYLQGCYTDSYIGTMRDLAQQGIPLIVPIQQGDIIKAVTLNSKLSKGLYDSLGEDVNKLKKTVATELTRGIATGGSYDTVAQAIARKMIGGASDGGNLYRAQRIARTEGHRVQSEAQFDALHAAKKRGADVVKQWRANLDAQTRDSHAHLDGEIHEIDDKFSNGLQFPGEHNGPAAEVINCRCRCAQRAKWALDDEELEELQKRAEYFGIDKSQSFEEFKANYIKATEEIQHPFVGKTYIMNGKGQLVEAAADGLHNVFTIEDAEVGVDVQINPDGSVTLLNSDKLITAEGGKDYGSAVWTLNDDGTFTEGKVKYQAQYKLNLNENNVLVLDTVNYIPGNEAEAIFQALPDELKKEVADKLNAYGGGASVDDVLKKVMADNGYKGISIKDFVNSDTYEVNQDVLKLFDDTIVKKTKKSKLETLSESLVKEQKKLAGIDNKVYSGIWYNQDVSVSQYELYKDKIQSKRDYYLQQLNIETDPVKIAKYNQFLADLDEFETLGKQYAAESSKISKIKNDIKKYTPRTSAGAATDAFSQARKDAAHWYTSSNGGFAAADAYFDPYAHTVHNAATSEEHAAFYRYTQGSGGFNRPLVGFRKPYAKSGTGWEQEFYVGPKAVWLDYEGQGDNIRALTTLISKSTYDGDVWIQSGQSYATLEGFLGIPRNSLEKMTDEQLQQFVGYTNIFEQFLSGAVNKGGGSIFNGQPMKMMIYAPTGSQMLYASDVGAFGKGENEMIMQRGGTYEITKIYRGRDPTDGNRVKIFVDLDLHSEAGYDLFQQDPNEWTGSRARNY